VAAELVQEVDERRRVDRLRVARAGQVHPALGQDSPRPRDLEVVYTPEFVDLVHELRGHIEQARK